MEGTAATLRFQAACESNLVGERFAVRGLAESRTEALLRLTLFDGRSYQAPWVRYDHEQALLYTDAPVTMQDNTGRFRGDGFRYFVKQRRFRLIGNVSLEQLE